VPLGNPSTACSVGQSTPPADALLGSIAWSVDLLDDADRPSCAVWPSSAARSPLEAAEAVGTDGDTVTSYDLVDVIGRLVVSCGLIQLTGQGRIDLRAGLHEAPEAYDGIAVAGRPEPADHLRLYGVPARDGNGIFLVERSRRGRAPSGHSRHTMGRMDAMSLQGSAKPVGP
jgi:hypothetical protein